MTKVKICGLRRPEDIEYVNELQPDYIGFILSQGFRRSIDIKTAADLKSALKPEIKTVGVFVNEDLHVIESFLKKGIIDIVQLHGEESAEYCREINAPTIKCFRCGDGLENGLIEKYDTDFYMFDSGAGSAKTFDWSIIPKTDKKFFLAGGLSANNLAEAIEGVQPYAVDISSGAETDGVKSYEKIKKIMEIVRNGER